MDCNTARMLFDCAGPNLRELDDHERAELERHLQDCPECAEHARAERLLDQHVGKAMRQVEVPAGLRTMLHGRLAAERGRGKRGRLRKYAAMAAAAAVLAMVGVGFSLWQAAHPPALDIEGIFNERNHLVAALTPANIEDDFARHGLSVVLPSILNYDLLQAHGPSTLQGKKVPQLIFTWAESDKDQRQIAQVYLLKKTQFDLRSLSQSEPCSEGYKFKLKVIWEEGDPQAIVIFYTGSSWKWLLNKDWSGTTQL